MGLFNVTSLDDASVSQDAEDLPKRPDDAGRASDAKNINALHPVACVAWSRRDVHNNFGV